MAPPDIGQAILADRRGAGIEYADWVVMTTLSNHAPDPARGYAMASVALAPAGQYTYDTTLVRAIAALLVANSHLEHFYPRAWMAGDGLLGNSLFFLLAGYGLVRSEQQRIRPFFEWMRRRVSRIYPTLFLVMGVFALLIGGAWRQWSPTDYVLSLLWPTGYTFVQLIIPFYLLFFVLMKAKRRWVFPWAIAATVVTYLVGYIPDATRFSTTDSLHLSARPMIAHISAYLGVMLLGGLLGWRRDRTPRSFAPRIAGFAAVSVFYLVAKFVMVQGELARFYILLHALTFAWCWLAFDCLGHEALLARIRSIGWVWRATALVGALTLEIYMVHSALIEYAWLYRVVFPLNIVAFWALTLPLSWLTARVVKWLQSLSRRITPTKGVASAPAAAG